MNNIIVLPVVIPLLAAIFVFFMKKYSALQRIMSMIGLLLTLIVSLYIVYTVSEDGIQLLQLGGWHAPFGIVLVADMFAALLVLTASVVSFLCLLYAFHSLNRDEEKRHFYTFFLLLLTGVNGSFLTGDIFNLFVFFEVMLLASYALLSFNGTKLQLRESLKYVLINMISSTLFVVAIAYLYAVTGTLNMAHLSEIIASVGQDGLITTVSMLFLTVFALKASLFLYFWLPGSYSVAPPAIIAMFAALLTKVGIYALFRMFTLIFYHEPHITHTVIIWLAAFTMILGAIGAVSTWDIRKILVYNIIIAVGFIVFGLGIFTETSLSGSIFYLLQDMIVKALIFILGGIMIGVARTHKLKEVSGLIHNHPILGWLFFISALALAGIPPLSGFVGKVMVLQDGLAKEHYIVAAIGLLTSLLALYSVIKIVINGFWGETTLNEEEDKERKSGRAILIPCILLAALSIAMGLGAESVLYYVEQASASLMQPITYINAVLNVN